MTTGSYRYVRRAHPFCRRYWFLPDTEQEILSRIRRTRRLGVSIAIPGLKVFITILFCLSLAVGGAGYAYYRGYGWPTQQSVVQDIFN